MDVQSKRYANGSFDGLSDLRYELQSVQLRPLYTWIHADLNGKMFTLLSNSMIRRHCIES